MIDIMKNEFIKYGGVLKTSELNNLGISSRQIKKLTEDGVISKIKRGFYELTGYIPKEEVIIESPSQIFRVIYGYTDRTFLV